MVRRLRCRIFSRRGLDLLEANCTVKNLVISNFNQQGDLDRGNGCYRQHRERLLHGHRPDRDKRNAKYIPGSRDRRRRERQHHWWNDSGRTQYHFRQRVHRPFDSRQRHHHQHGARQLYRTQRYGHRRHSERRRGRRDLRRRDQ